MPPIHASARSIPDSPDAAAHRSLRNEVYAHRLTPQRLWLVMHGSIARRMPAALPWDRDTSVAPLRDAAQNCVKNDSGGSAAPRLAPGTTRARPHRAMTWAHIGTVMLAAFLASLVECVEALTVAEGRHWAPVWVFWSRAERCR